MEKHDIEDFFDKKSELFQEVVSLFDGIEMVVVVGCLTEILYLISTHSYENSEDQLRNLSQFFRDMADQEKIKVAVAMN